MNQRERVLLIVVIALGAVGVLFGAQLAYSSVAGWFQSGKNRIAGLERQLAEKQRIVRETQAAKRKIADWKSRSLPGDPGHARSLYRAWLFDGVVAAKFANPNVTAGADNPQRGLYTGLSFTVSGTGNLQQIVDLLYDFYAVDHLHRISRLKIVPTKEPKQFLLTMTVEALSMDGAPDADELAQRPGKRLEMPTREDYLTAILNRNLFGAPNQPPRLSGLGDVRAETGREFTAVAEVTDDDAADKHTFKLEKSEARDAYLDSSSGAFRWTPRRTGTYEFTISVTDDGIPAKTATEKLIVTVGDAPAPPPQPRTLAFDEAKFTVLAAVIDNSGTSEIWLHVRPRDRNAILKLGVGDSFEIGSVKGTVKSIAGSSFVFESDGRLMRLGTREFLANAESATQ
ncbi:MAG TPA: Ig domain-containing protein [Pirellulaceae bacterium]|nr:Ig domain-containing protein [Pirellulaceae bacterium]